MDALLWYGLAIAAVGILGTAGRWADRQLLRPTTPRRARLARLVLNVTLAAFYLAFAIGVAALLYTLATWSPQPTCDSLRQICP